MTRFGKVLATMIAVILIGLVLRLASPVEAVSEGYCVFERIDAHSPASHVISRTDWLSVAQCSEAAMMAPRWLRAPENPPSSQMTAAEASALMDGIRLSFGSPGPTDRFHQRCDRSHTVWNKAGTNPPVRAFTHVDLGTETAGIGYIPEKTGLCCEDAAMMVSPAPAPDCRAFNLVSVAGQVARTPAGWTMIGGPVTVTPPGKPPITISAMASAAMDDPTGEYVCRLSTSSPRDECHSTWLAAADKEVPATVSPRSGQGLRYPLYRMDIHHGQYGLQIGPFNMKPDGSISTVGFQGIIELGHYKNGEWKIDFPQRACVWTVHCSRKK